MGDALEQEAVKSLVPLGFASAVGARRGLVDAVADADAAVRVHPRDAVVPGQLRFGDGASKSAEDIGRGGHHKRGPSCPGNRHAPLSGLHIELFLQRDCLKR